ncbi:MAG: hypothetical protein HW399_604, partial [Dehalococcoidia bacterium]|nr:hypothetical protein [Dehalococcoidia bacterium]
EDGYRTYDIMETGKTLMGTKGMGEKVAERI